jgi:hypothetical protein
MNEQLDKSGHMREKREQPDDLDYSLMCAAVSYIYC